MKPLAARRLTEGERGLAYEMFGDDIRPEQVRVFAIPVWNRPFVAGPGLIVWPASRASTDFAAETVAVQGVFVHELTHVWQAQNGVSLLFAKLKAGDSAASYAYDLTGGPDFGRLNIEQQAMVVQHAFLASRGAPAPHPAQLYANASSAWRRG